MPKILERCVKKVKAQQKKPGRKKVNPYAACTSSLQKAGKLKKGGHDGKEKGRRRSRRLS